MQFFAKPFKDWLLLFEILQVYQLDRLYGSDTCLSGTAEMGIAHYLQGKTFSKSVLPLKLAAVSRCFRAETSKISVEKGLYRYPSKIFNFCLNF